MSFDAEVATMLADQVDRLLAESIDVKTLELGEKGSLPMVIAETLASLDLSLALVPEDAGGSGLRWLDLAGLIEALGYHAAPGGIAEAIGATWAVQRGGLSAIEGVQTLSLDTVSLESGVLTGRCHVAWPKPGAYATVMACCGAETRLCLVELPSDLAPTASLGRDPLGLLVLDGLAPVEISPEPVSPQMLIEAMAVMRAGQIAGALARILELVIDYANTRQQFGRPIGKFQAIQHMIAEIASEVAAASAAARLGCRALDGETGPSALACAKLRASLAATRSVMKAHAVMGAIGITEEHVMHHLTRRLWQWRDDAGSEHEWALRLGRQLLEGDQPLWQRVVTG